MSLKSINMVQQVFREYMPQVMFQVLREASSAMIEGRMSGASIACYLGYMTEEERDARIEELENQLETLRQGMFCTKEQR